MASDLSNVINIHLDTRNTIKHPSIDIRTKYERVPTSLEKDWSRASVFIIEPQAVYYFAYSHPSYGWIIMDSENSMLMIENPIEELEIPRIHLTSTLLNKKMHYCFCIYDIYMMLMFRSNMSVRECSDEALEYFVKLNKERRRNARILA